MQKALITLAIVTGLGTGLGACGASAPDGSIAYASSSCLRPQNINSWTLINSDTVIVNSGVSKYFQLDLRGPCPQFDWTRSLGFETRNGVTSTSLVCPNTPEQLTVVMPVGDNLMRCPVKALRELTPSEVAALPPAARP